MNVGFAVDASGDVRRLDITDDWTGAETLFSAMLSAGPLPVRTLEVLPSGVRRLVVDMSGPLAVVWVPLPASGRLTMAAARKIAAEVAQ